MVLKEQIKNIGLTVQLKSDEKYLVFLYTSK